MLLLNKHRLLLQWHIGEGRYMDHRHFRCFTYDLFLSSSDTMSFLGLLGVHLHLIVNNMFLRFLRKNVTSPCQCRSWRQCASDLSPVITLDNNSEIIVIHRNCTNCISTVTFGHLKSSWDLDFMLRLFFILRLWLNSWGFGGTDRRSFAAEDNKVWLRFEPTEFSLQVSYLLNIMFLLLT